MFQCSNGTQCFVMIIFTNRKKEDDQSSCVASASCVCDCVSPPDMFIVLWISASCSLALALSAAMLLERSSSELGPSGLSHFPDLWVTGCTLALGTAPAAFVHGEFTSPSCRLSQCSPSEVCVCCLKLLLAFSDVSSLSVFT